MRTPVAPMRTAIASRRRSRTRTSPNRSGLLVALNGKRLHLASDNELSSFDFTSASAATFFAQLQVQDHSTAYCFGDVPCFDRTLLANTQGAPGFSSTNPVVFYARLAATTAPGINQNNLSAIHFYDSLTLQANATTKRFTGPAGTSFARMDGVAFDSGAAAVIAAGTYSSSATSPPTTRSRSRRRRADRR